MQGVIKDAIKEKADGGGRSDLCTAHTIAQDDSTPTRFMFLLYFIDEAPGDPGASQILAVVTRQVWDLHLMTVLSFHAVKEQQP